MENFLPLLTIFLGGFLSGFCATDAYKYFDYRRKARFLHKLVQERSSQEDSNERSDSPDNTLTETENGSQEAS